MGVNEASRNFGVPGTTLRGRMSGGAEHNTKSGTTPYLSQHVS